LILNYFEESLIRNNYLPAVWQSQSALDEFDQFLQFNWEQRSVFYDDNTIRSRQQFISFTGQRGIRTGRYIGTVVFKGHQLNIFPKMFRTESEDHETQDLELSHMMKNLVQWVEYCTRFEYPYINIKSDLDDANDLRELFIALYLRYLQAAIDYGLFYQYEDITEDSAVIKGKIDIKDYLYKKMPNGNTGRFLCTYSSFELDNKVNRIIKCTCKLLGNDVRGANQRILQYILAKLNDVSDENCTPGDCDTIKLSRLHDNYRMILSMSKMFLLNQTSMYELDTNESFCFLFPTDYLFEGFIGGFIQSILHGKAKVRLQASEISLVDDIRIEGQSYGRAFTMRHDILVEHKEKGLFIFDTKYKGISRIKDNPEAHYNVTQEANQPDLYQMFTYAIKRDVNDIYLLYPMYRFEDEDDAIPQLEISHSINDESHTITVHVVRLPFIFENDAESTITRLASVINSIFV